MVPVPEQMAAGEYKGAVRVFTEAASLNPEDAGCVSLLDLLI